MVDNGIMYRTGFNPRPAFSCGAAPMCCARGNGILAFQSAPRILVRSGPRATVPAKAPMGFQSAPRILVRSGRGGRANRGRFT